MKNNNFTLCITRAFYMLMTCRYKLYKCRLETMLAGASERFVHWAVRHPIRKIIIQVVCITIKTIMFLERSDRINST